MVRLFPSRQPVQAHFNCYPKSYRRLTEIGALAVVIIISKVLCQCGNGAIDAGEACDDGNAVISDGCTNCNIDTGYTCAGAPSVCANTYHWGDGVLEAGEAWDDGNLLSNDGWENTCQLTPGWTWNTASPNVCTEVCGDGYDFGKLGWDDNNTLYLDGWSETCTVDADFQWGGGTSSNPDDCFEINGDGRDYGWFACDDGNKSPNCDGWDRDGNILPGYLCNAGTPTNPDRCWTEWGDGLRVCAEVCDDGNKNPGDGCSDAWVVEAGYTCDGGNFWRADYWYEIWGDGLDIGFYDWDDGNLVNGDGWDDSCVIELGYTCTGGTAASADTWTEICGDGIDLFNYPWDDGNLVNGDGCDATWNIEPGWDCQYGTRDWHDECWHWHNNPAIVGYEINNESMVSLYFNASVEIPTDWNDFTDIKIEIHGPRTEQNYYLTRYFSLRNKTTALMAPNHSKVWNIDIAYSPHIQFLGDGVENITITITDRRRVTHNQYGFVLINNKAYAKLEHPTENDRSWGMEGWWKVAYWLYISLVINNFSFFLLGASLWHTIGITMSLQMIIYYPMMHNYPPSCLSRFFQDFQVTIGKMEWFNIQEFVLGTKPEDLVKDGSTNYRFERQNFVRYNMLYNAVEVIFIWVIALIACVAVFLLRILCLNNSLIASYEKRFRWEITVKGFILVYQHVMTCWLLNIRHPQGSPKIYATATALSNIIFITFLVLYALMAILLLYFKTLGPKAKSKWFCKGLLRDIDTSHISKYMYYLVYLLKKTIFAFTFAFAHDWGLVPYNITAVFVIFFPLMYLIYARPFSHRLTNIHMIYNELNEMLITSMYFNYFDPHLTDWEFYMYARITVIDIAIWVVVSYIIFLLSLPRFCKIKWPKRKPKIYLPDYEEEIQQELDSPISSEHDFIIEAAHVDVKEANRRLDSFSSDDKEEGEREVLDDDLDEDLEDLERDDNAEL